MVIFNEEIVANTKVFYFGAPPGEGWVASNPDEVIAHELIGEGYLSTASSTKESVAKDFRKRDSKTALQAIQVGNIARRILNLAGFRKGEPLSHSPAVKTEDQGKTQEIPAGLKTSK